MSNPNLTYLEDVTRLEIIHHDICESCKGSGQIHIEGQDMHFECPACHGAGVTGRDVIFHNSSKQIEASLQDDGRTLKIFVKERIS